MQLVKCTRIAGKPKHRIETCWERKDKARAEAERLKPINDKARRAGTGVTPMDHALASCLCCDPTEMKTVEVDTSGYAEPVVVGKKAIKKQKAIEDAKERAEKLKTEAKEEAVTKKTEFVCTMCGEKTDNPDKFIHEKGICRKCYMKEYYKKNPKKKGSTLAPKKSRQGQDVVEKMLAGAEAVTPKGTVLDTPVKNLTLRDVVKAGGEVRIAEKPTPGCKVCGITCTEADTFNIERLICGKCERKAVILTAEEVKGMKHTLRAAAKDGQGEILILAVDFTGRIDIYDFLKKMADEDFRSPEMEILALLDDLMRRKQTKEEKC